MITLNTTPFANLDPNVILDAIESIGFQCSGSLLALNSYENRVYQVGIEEQSPLIAKFYRPARWRNETILEEHEFATELVRHEIPVVAPLANSLGETLHTYQDFRFALFPRQGGRALELDDLEQLEWMGRFLGRLHAVSACKPFQHRMELTAQTYGHQPYQYLIEHDFIPLELKNSFTSTVETTLKLIEEHFQSIDQLKRIRLHGDCHPGNILWNTTGPHIVDLDDCLMGPAVQDIWMLISAKRDNLAETRLQLDCILEGYQEFHDFDYRELRLIESLRALRMIHYSAWLAKRWEDPAFPANFPWFNTIRYWQEQIQNLREQADILAETEIEGN